MKRLLGLCASIAVVGSVSGCSDSPEISPMRPDLSAVAARVVEDPSPDPGCESGASAALIAGQYHESGFVSVVTDGTTLLVEISTEEGWRLVESHLAVAGSMEDFPQRNGNPVPGRFENSALHDAGATLFQYSVDLSTSAFGQGDEIYIAVHAAVERVDADGNVVQSETAWADGEGFPGRNWATYLHFELGQCPDGEGEGESEGGDGGGGGE